MKIYKYRLKFISTLVVILTYQPQIAIAQPPLDTAPPRITLSKPPSSASSSSVDLGITAGSGTYPVLELPLMASSSPISPTRVDGSTYANDLTYNRGILLAMSLGKAVPTSWSIWHLSADLQRIGSPPSGGRPTPSSYFRLSTSADAQINMGNLISGLAVTPGVELRRSMYRNLESGHYIDAVLLKMALSQAITHDFSLSVSGGYAPVTTFGLLQRGNIFNSKPLSQSTSTMSEIGGELHYALTPRSELFTGIRQESVNVTLTGNDGYRAYGLPVASFDDTEVSRSYDLTTAQVFFGVVKHF